MTMDLLQEGERTAEALEMEINVVDSIKDSKGEILDFAGIITEILIVANQMIAIKKVKKIQAENLGITLIREGVMTAEARMISAIGSRKNLISAILGMKKTKFLVQNV